MQSSSISNFRHFVRSILLPLALLLAAAGWVTDIAFTRLVIFHNAGCGAYKVNRIINELHENEIPIFGSSRAEGCFIPDSLGPNYFNYGLSGTKYDVTLFFLQEECKKQKKTPWILLNLDLDGLLYSIGDLSNYIPDSREQSVRELLGNNNSFYFTIPFIRYYGRYETYMRQSLVDKMELTKFSDKGAAIEKNILPPAQFNALVDERRATTTIFTVEQKLFSGLSDLIKSHPERKFIFIVSPYHSSFFVKFENEHGYRALADNLLHLRNVRFLDYSRLLMPDNCYMNTSHLNLKGALIFNRLVRDSLKKMGVQ